MSGERFQSNAESYLMLLEQGFVVTPFYDARDRTPELDRPTAAWLAALERFAAADGLRLHWWTYCHISWPDTLVELARPDGTPFPPRRLRVLHGLFPGGANRPYQRQRRRVLPPAERAYGPVLTAARERARERVGR